MRIISKPIVDILLVIIELDQTGRLADHAHIVDSSEKTRGLLQGMGFVDDGVGPQVSSTSVEGGEYAALSVRETPVCLITRIGLRMRCCNIDSAFLPKVEGNVRTRVLIPCRTMLQLARPISMIDLSLG